MQISIGSEAAYTACVLMALFAFFFQIFVVGPCIPFIIYSVATKQSWASNLSMLNILIVNIVWVGMCFVSEIWLNIARRCFEYPWGRYIIPFLWAWDMCQNAYPGTNKVMLYCPLDEYTSLTEYFSTQTEQLKAKLGKKSVEHVFAKNCQRVFLRQMPNKIAKLDLKIKTHEFNWLRHEHVALFVKHLNQVSPIKGAIFFALTEFLSLVLVAGQIVDEFWVEGDMVAFATTAIFGDDCLVPGAFCAKPDARKMGLWFWGYRLALKRSIAHPRIKYMTIGAQSTEEKDASILMAKRKTMCQKLSLDDKEKQELACRLWGLPSSVISLANFAEWWACFWKGIGTVEEDLFVVKDASDVVGW